MIAKQSIARNDTFPSVGTPFCQGIAVGDYIFTMGHAGILVEGDKVELKIAEPDDIRKQTARTIENLKRVLNSAGVGLGDVVKATLFVANMDDYAAINEVYGSYIGVEPPPRTSCELPRFPIPYETVKFDMIAYRKPKRLLGAGGAFPSRTTPFSQGVVAGDLVFTMGHSGISMEAGGRLEIAEPWDIKKQTERTLENLAAVLSEEGLSLKDVVGARVFLTSMDDYAAVNEVYAYYMGPDYPARTSCQVTRLVIPFERVKIDMIASKVSKKVLGRLDNLPSERFPVSQAVQAGKFIFTMGHCGIGIRDGHAELKIVDPNDVVKQSIRTMENLDACLAEAGASLKDVVQATMFLQDMDDYRKVNKVFYDYMGPDYPARISCEVLRFALPWEKVKMDMVAYKEGT